MTITYKGRTVFSELGEIFDPKHTAVLVIDTQNEFLSPGGAFHKASPERVARLRQCLPAQAEFISTAQKVGARVVYSGASHLPNHATESDANIARLLSQWTDELPEWTLHGSWGREWVPELPKLTDRDFDVPKHRASAFEGTDSMLLRANRIESVIIGQSTSGCVFYTAHDAMMAGYVGVATDCVSDREQNWHEAARRSCPACSLCRPSTPIVETW